MNEYISIDAESVKVNMKQLVNLLNIVIDDFVDNGEQAARRELTISALYIIMDHLDLLSDMQGEIVGQVRKLEREAAHDD